MGNKRNHIEINLVCPNQTLDQLNKIAYSYIATMHIHSYGEYQGPLKIVFSLV
jgi:hypothetical protein